MSEEGLRVNVGNIASDNFGAPHGQQKASQEAPTPQPTAKSLDRALIDLGHHATLSAEASKYIKELEVQFNDVVAQVGTDKLKLVPVSCEQVSIYRLSYADSHILMAFADSYTPPADAPHMPPAKYLAETAGQLAATKGIRIATTVVVIPESYPLVTKMVQFLRQAFFVLEFPEMYKFSLSDISSGQYTAVVDINRVRRIIEDNSPNGILPPTDVGLALFKNYGKNKEPRLLLAIGGTTTFVAKTATGEPLMSGKEFTPKVTITSLYTPTPTLSMGIFGITLAAEHFIRRSGWLSQFNRFDGDENIGNLIPLDNGKPFNIENQSQLFEFINTRLDSPVLSIDIADGMPRIPGLELITVNNVIDEVANFLGCSVEQLHNVPICSETHIQFGGIFKSGDDIRNTTYLRLVNQNPKNAMAYTPLLVRNTDPAFTLKHLEEIFSGGSIIPIYTNVNAILNAPFLNMITEVSKSLKIGWETDNAAINNLGALPTGTINQFGNCPMFGGIQSGGINYQQTIYGGQAY